LTECEHGEFQHLDDLMPDGATPLVAIRVVKYLDEDGEGAVNWHIDGTPTRETLAGMLEMVKFDALRSMLGDLAHSEEED
jgi:hypothetical protein